MAKVAARRPEVDEEEDLIDEVEDYEDDSEEEDSLPAAPAVSDSRRRRQLKQGVAPTDQPVPVRKDRPTPSQRSAPAENANFLTRFRYNLRVYWQETQGELAKVAWPTREETIRLTQIVLAVTAIAAIFLGLVSFLFSLLTTQLATAENTAVAGGIAVVLIIATAGLWLFRERLFGSDSE